MILQSDKVASGYDEVWLRDLPPQHPKAIAVDEIDAPFGQLIAVRRELDTRRAGPADAPYINHLVLPTLAVCKLGQPDPRHGSRSGESAVPRWCTCLAGLMRRHRLQNRTQLAILASTGRRFRLFRRLTVTDTSRRNGGYPPKLLNLNAFDSPVWADSACRSQTNEAASAAAGRPAWCISASRKGGGCRDRTSVPTTPARPCDPPSSTCSPNKERMALFIRTIGLDRATVKIGVAHLAYDFRRLIWPQRREAPA